MLVPCASTEEDSCIWEEDEVQEYLGPNWQMYVYQNQHSFKSESYSDERIEKKSVLTKIRHVYEEGLMDAKYTEFFVNKNQLSDEADLLQLGQSDDIEFATITHTESKPSKANQWPT